MQRQKLTPFDYRGFRLNKIFTPEYRHTLYLLFWPLFGLVFLFLERIITMPHYHAIHCGFDDIIPFCEFFIIPYYFWFAFIFWMLIYSFFFDIPTFVKFSRFIIITYSITCFIYIIFPNMQELRPVEFERDNIFVDITVALHSFDTNTNVCPSLHVAGSLAVMFAGWHSKRYSTAAWRIAFTVTALLICISTVFLKQHSIIDVVTALVLCFAAYPFVFLKKKRRNNGKKGAKILEKNEKCDILN